MTQRGQAPVGPLAGIFLGYGLRPFFLFAGIYATIVMSWWAAWLAFGAGNSLVPAALPAPMWHGHELLFGFAVAVIAGFLLTAVPSWSGTPILPRPRLVALVAVWLAGRAAVWLGGALPAILVAAVDIAFPLVLAVLVAGPIFTRSARRNAVFVVVLLVLAAANAMVHLEAMAVTGATAGPGLLLAADAIVVLIVILGGRVIPAFTGAALRRRDGEAGLRTSPALDVLAILSVVAVLAIDLALPGTEASGIAALIAAALQAARLAGWRGLACLDEPILWVLHLGYLWIVAGLLLKGLADIGWGADPTAALHALTAGAIGTMTMGVMSRAALGHTGRALEVSSATTAGYVLVSLGALARIVGPLALPDHYGAAMTAAALLWAGGFALFSVVHWPILTRPRVDGRPG